MWASAPTGRHTGRPLRAGPRHPRRGRCPHRPAAPAPVNRQASGSVKWSRGNAITTPITSAPSATGQQLQKLQKRIACPTVAQIGACTDTPTPVARGGPLHRSAPKRLFLFHRARRILFLGKTKKRMGGAPLWEHPPGRSQTSEAAGRRPTNPPMGPRPSKISSICENKTPLKLL